MKKLIIWLSLLMIVAADTPPAFAQGGGCPALPPSTGGDFEVLQSIPVAPAIPENPTPQTEAQGIFYQNQITIDYQGQQVMLNAYCVDDALLLRDLTTGKQWYWDYRSPDRTQIETTPPPVDISHLFSSLPGKHRLEISLIDLSPEHHSASPIFIALSAGNLQPLLPTPPPIISQPSTTDKGIPVFGSSAQTPESLTTLTPALATVTLTPTKAITKPMSLAVVQPTSIPSGRTEVARITDSEGNEDLEGPESADASNFSWPWPLIPALLIGLAGLVPLLAVAGAIKHRNSTNLDLTVTIFERGQYLTEVDLASLKRPVTTIGSQGDILLPSAEVPAIAARLRAQRNGKQVETLFERLDPQTGEVLHSRTLLDGDQEVIGIFQLKFNFDEVDEFDEGEFDD